MKYSMCEKPVILLFMILFLIIPGAFKPATGQRLFVGNVSFVPVDKNVVVINYDLLANGKNRKFKVDLLVRQTSNPIFQYQPKAVIGDIGIGRFEGIGNKILWSMDHEDPHKFVPNPFINDYYFQVSARRKSSTGFLFATAILGAIGYLLISNEVIAF